MEPCGTPTFIQPLDENEPWQATYLVLQLKMLVIVRAVIKHYCYDRKSFLELNSKTPTIHIIIWDDYMLSKYMYENYKMTYEEVLSSAT